MRDATARARIRTGMADPSISQLNAFLRHELAAVAAYRETISRIQDGAARSTLEECLRSHEERTERLEARVRHLGGAPASGGGAWTALAKALEKGALAAGERIAIAALEEGEDFGLRDYKKHLGALDPDSRALVERELLPRQEQTHRALSGLKMATY